MGKASESGTIASDSTSSNDTPTQAACPRTAVFTHIESVTNGHSPFPAELLK